ncbi:hypothetical protein ARALYDRAFT_485493 [Arabidopsis lyrata subsp. lyrata]|uniref:Uncharacterized protein n=1 Tax=Arabidopsis lyrata subsp. lyrata TaxID=81972 RepID=D7LTU7_ARALL|nr:hypothetical protein ARALYDRAFT_485493 [Arabidopsis lyrata subsp. lyrata]
MAFPETKLQMPIRSISLPSRIHHPSAKFQAALSQIHLFQNSSDSQSLQASLLNLSELYHSLHQLNHSLPTAQAEHSLDVSATLLDSCDAARNLILTLREHLLNLQSALRRKDKSMEVQIKEYFSFRKKIKKETNKLLLGLKKVSIFRSLFMFLSTTSTVKTKTCSLKFVSKLISGGHRSSSSIMSELQNVDVVLRSDGDNSKEMKKMLERLEERTEELEAALDSLFKSLVQYRVYLLNILTTHS